MLSRISVAQRRSRQVLLVTLMVASTLVSLLIVEGTLRLVGWAEVVAFTPNPEFGFLMTPSQEISTYGHPVRINSFGLRGPEIPAAKDRHTTRIVFIGDSVTYGGGRIREEQLFCRIANTVSHRQSDSITSWIANQTVNAGRQGRLARQVVREPDPVAAETTDTLSCVEHSGLLGERLESNRRPNRAEGSRDLSRSAQHVPLPLNPVCSLGLLQSS